MELAMIGRPDRKEDPEEQHADGVRHGRTAPLPCGSDSPTRVLPGKRATPFGEPSVMSRQLFCSPRLVRCLAFRAAA